MTSTLAGLIAAPHTPFHPSGEIAFGAIARQAAFLAHNGVNGAFICGTTGEGPSLTHPERRRVAETWMAAKPRDLAVIVHVGDLSLKASCELAAHAQVIGAQAVATVAPSYFKPATVPALVDWCAAVAAAAPALPFYYYHIPIFTGVRLPVASFLAEAQARIPNLAGIKFTHEDLMDFAQAISFGDHRYNILFGRDEILLAGLALGAKGAVGSTYNFAAPIYQRVMESFAKGDLASARRDQAKAVAMIEVLNRHGGMSAGKAVMKLLGVDCGPMRPPLASLSEGQEAQLRTDLAAIGFFEYACQPARA